MSGAAQYKDGQYCGDLALYDVRREEFIEYRSHSKMLFEDMPPSSAGTPPENTLLWWLDEHGGYNEVVESLDKIPFIVQLRWDSDQSAALVPARLWGTARTLTGGGCCITKMRMMTGCCTSTTVATRACRMSNIACNERWIRSCNQ